MYSIWSTNVIIRMLLFLAHTQYTLLLGLLSNIKCPLSLVTVAGLLSLNAGTFAIACTLCLHFTYILYIVWLILMSTVVLCCVCHEMYVIHLAFNHWLKQIARNSITNLQNYLAIYVILFLIHMYVWHFDWISLSSWVFCTCSWFAISKTEPSLLRSNFSSSTRRCHKVQQ